MTANVQELNDKRQIRGVGEAVRSTVDGMWRIYKRLPVDAAGQPCRIKKGPSLFGYEWFTLSSAKKLKDAIDLAKATGA